VRSFRNLVDYWIPLADGDKRSLVRAVVKDVKVLEQVEVLLLAVDLEQAHRQRLVVDQAEKVAGAELALELEEDIVDELCIAAIDGLDQGELVLLHVHQQRHLLRGTRLVVQEPGSERRPADLVRSLRNLRVRHALCISEFLHDCAAHGLVVCFCLLNLWRRFNHFFLFVCLDCTRTFSHAQ